MWAIWDFGLVTAELQLEFNLSKFNATAELTTSVYRGISNKNRIISGAVVHQTRLQTVKNDNRFADLTETILDGEAYPKP